MSRMYYNVCNSWRHWFCKITVWNHENEIAVIAELRVLGFQNAKFRARGVDASIRDLDRWIQWKRRSRVNWMCTKCEIYFGKKEKSKFTQKKIEWCDGIFFFFCKLWRLTSSDTSPVIMWIDVSRSVTYIPLGWKVVIKKIRTDLVVMALGI